MLNSRSCSRSSESLSTKEASSRDATVSSASSAKAVREAAEEGGLSKEFERRIAVLRKPVFSIGTLAMVVTLVTALVGASVDTGMLPAGIHGVVAYTCLAFTLFALRVEINALTESGRIVAEVNQLLNA